MPQSKAIYVIDSKKQLTALASAARQEILDVLVQMGTVSVAELAATLGRAPDALYYHLRILMQTGLAESAGNRRTERRREELFRAVARDLRINYELSRQRNEKTLTAVIGSMLRLGIRDFRDAIRNEEVIVSGKHRELWASRKTGRLAKSDLNKVIELIKRLGQSVAGSSGNGQLYGITVLFTPLNRRRNKRNANGSR
jgi:DNA-binding transcriptional ArsR family regulator